MNNWDDDPGALDREPPHGGFQHDDEQNGCEPQRGQEHNGARLARIIESDIVPRLMLAYRSMATEFVAPDGAGPVEVDPGDVEQFARLVVERDAATVNSYVSGLRSSGMPLETLLLGLLAPTARHLGRLWEEDLYDFTQVTVGLGRLQQLLRTFSTPTDGDVLPDNATRRALLAPVPGEQHTLGISLVADFLRRSGWDVTTAGSADEGTLAGLVRRDWFALAGLSASCERHLRAVAKAVQVIRATSRNGDIRVMVGGPLFVANPGLVRDVGADCTAADARETARCAEELARDMRRN